MTMVEFSLQFIQKVKVGIRISFLIQDSSQNAVKQMILTTEQGKVFQ